MEFRDPRDHRSPFAICYYVTEPRTWVPGELVTSGMMNTLRDGFLEIEAGTAQMLKVTLVGDTTGNLGALESDPYEAALAYDITLNQIVASIDGGPFAALAGGDAAPIVFTPAHNNPPASAFATPDVRNSHPVLNFDATTDESSIFAGTMWPDYDGEDIEVAIDWAAATATSNEVRLDAQLERMNTDIDSDSFASAKSVTSAATNGTSGVVTRTTITFTASEIDGLVASDPFRLKLTRDANHADDDMAGDFQILRVTMRKA